MKWFWAVWRNGIFVNLLKKDISLLQLQENSRDISWQPSPLFRNLEKGYINPNYDHYNWFGLISGQSSEVTPT